jgi:hypothetical protein
VQARSDGDDVLSAVTCPVVHTGLNWAVIALLIAVLVAIVGGTLWGAIERALDRRAAAAPSGELGSSPAGSSRERYERGRW